MDIRDTRYYETAQKGSFSEDPSNKLIFEIGKNASRILDIGCGEGTRLHLINNGNAHKVGVDQSNLAISLAKRKYHDIKFLKVGSTLPFADSSFDFVYSAFVLEHLNQPEEFINESVRVLAPGGKIIFAAPNFGSPNRASPNNKIPRVKKFTEGIAKDMNLIKKSKVNRLDWRKVESKKEYLNIDDDTTIEPYLLSLEKYLEGLKIKKIKSTSLWGLEKRLRCIQIPFMILGTLRTPPFNRWGPRILYLGEKYE